MSKQGEKLVSSEVQQAQAKDGWSPVGNRVAGARDAVTGQLETHVSPQSSAAAMRKLLALAGGAAAIAALYFGQDVLVPITLAIMLSFILDPMVSLLQRFRIWRVPAVILTVLAALGLIGALGTLIGMQAASLSVNAPEYARAIEAKVGSLQTSATQRMSSITNTLGGSRNPPRPPVSSSQNLNEPAASATGSNVLRGPIQVEVAPPKTTPFSVAKTILEPIVGPLETTVIVLIVAIFVLMQKEDLRDRFIRVFGSTDLHRTTLALDDAGVRLSRYFTAQLGVNTAFGIVVGLGLWFFGVPSPILWGVLAGMLRFVPYIGAVLAAVAPVALGAAIDPGWSTAIFIALFFVVVESLIGYVVEPLLYGHSTGLSPVSVIIAAIFWTSLWGPIGLILSTPLTLCLVVLGRHVKALEVFDVVLGDRPALTPIESFYQRVLANNTDEALAHAETMLAEQSLLDYYDNVVVAALRLAASDAASGTIDTPRVSQMVRAMTIVTEDLVGHVDLDEGVERLAVQASARTVACIAGRDPFDDVVATMLAQILEQRGMITRFIDHEAASRGVIGDLDIDGIDTIVITHLSLVGSPAHLRSLLRRLRQKAPGATIIVGLWPQVEATLADQTIQAALGADRYVGSLRDATAEVVALGVGEAPVVTAPERADQ